MQSQLAARKRITMRHFLCLGNPKRPSIQQSAMDEPCRVSTQALWLPASSNGNPGRGGFHSGGTLKAQRGESRSVAWRLSERRFKESKLILDTRDAMRGLSADRAKVYGR
jgi:hypothetical protein